MTGIPTADDVIRLIGLHPNNVDTNRRAEITSLINASISELEDYTGRKLTSQTLTDVTIEYNKHYSWGGYIDAMYFLGVYADMYEVTDVKRNGTSLTQRSATSRFGWYFDDNVSGKIVFKNLFENYVYDLYYDTYSITGKYGFINRVNGQMRMDVWELIREMTAVKSRYWSRIDRMGREYIQDEYPEYTIKRMQEIQRVLN